MEKLAEKIGIAKISQAIHGFYQKAFDDLIIGYMFHSLDKERLIKGQINFTISLLNQQNMALGKVLKKNHQHLTIKTAYFNRRQVLMQQAIKDAQIDPELGARWLELEQQMKPYILNSKC